MNRNHNQCINPGVIRESGLSSISYCVASGKYKGSPLGCGEMGLA